MKIKKQNTRRAPLCAPSLAPALDRAASMQDACQKLKRPKKSPVGKCRQASWRLVRVTPRALSFGRGNSFPNALCRQRCALGAQETLNAIAADAMGPPLGAQETLPLAGNTTTSPFTPRIQANSERDALRPGRPCVFAKTGRLRALDASLAPGRRGVTKRPFSQNRF